MNLLTMTKRTSSRVLPQLSAPYIIEYTGVDKVGTLGAISSLLAEHQVYIGALRSETIHPTVDGPAHTHTVMTVQLPTEMAVEQLRDLVMKKLAKMQLTGNFVLQS
ncbi:MAG: hypothetical protein U5L01_05405 [Rheinheimera sp.]|nr:hypothetical protein [Rheinheimera sp.]